MTDAELWEAATKLDSGRTVPRSQALAIAAYVARYTDPTPLAECLDRIAGERGGTYITNVPFGGPYATFGDVTVWSEGYAQMVIEERDAAYRVAVATAGELHRLLDTMGVTT